MLFRFTALGLAAGLYLLQTRLNSLQGWPAGDGWHPRGHYPACRLRSGVGAEIGIFLVVILLSARQASGWWGPFYWYRSLVPIKFLADAGRIPDRVLRWVSNPVATDSRDEIIALYRETGGDWFWFGVGKVQTPTIFSLRPTPT
jgi:hypothetical protein